MFPHHFKLYCIFSAAFSIYLCELFHVSFALGTQPRGVFVLINFLSFYSCLDPLPADILTLIIPFLHKFIFFILNHFANSPMQRFIRIQSDLFLAKSIYTTHHFKNSRGIFLTHPYLEIKKGVFQFSYFHFG